MERGFERALHLHGRLKLGDHRNPGLQREFLPLVDHLGRVLDYGAQAVEPGGRRIDIDPCGSPCLRVIGNQKLLNCKADFDFRDFVGVGLAHAILRG